MKNNEILPAISLRGLVVFPSMVLHFDVGRERSVNALKAATEGDGHIFLVAQKDAANADPEIDELYEIGVVAEVRQLLTTPDGSTRVLVEGLYRAKRVKTANRTEYLRFEVKALPARNTALSDTTKTACRRALKNAFIDYAQITPKMPRELYDSIVGEEDCEKLFEKVVFNVVLKVEDKQRLLETNGTLNRIKTLIGMLTSELEIIETEMDIQEQVKEQVDKNQREYYLREQLRVISRQLGDGDSPQEEVERYIEQIAALGLSEDVTDKLVKEAEKLMKMSYSSQEAGVIRGYLDTV
ncbi:MAG: LON peptidase substrate-binding domain-containing protein, partial [Oscillospiraceae bacterium]|nr:LON peptidase substrate-binding domain-containing protein [Oscillospiraceae bacterium]